MSISAKCTFRSYPPLDPDIIRPVIRSIRPLPESGLSRRSGYGATLSAIFPTEREAEDEEIADAEDKVKRSRACRTGVIDT